MPKRVVDGEALWLSEKVRSLPVEYRFHYANWLPLAEANGVFEINPDRIHARIYAYLNPTYSVKKVKKILDAYVEAGLVKTWTQDSKNWGFFIGMNKPGRLPSEKHLGRYGTLPPDPPKGAETVAPDRKFKDNARVVYFLQSDSSERIKIGSSLIRRVKGRIWELSTASSDKLKCLGVLIEAPGRTEYDLHKQFQQYREHGEWFKNSTDLLSFIAENAVPLDMSGTTPGDIPTGLVLDLDRNGSGKGSGQETNTPLTGEDMAFNQNIANIAAEILKFTKGLTTHEKGELKLLARAYGTDRVETDFEAWARENRGGNIQYPISLYLKKANDRLKSEPEPEIADDPRIRQVTAKVYEMTGRLPINADLTNITKWLTKYSVEDIITGFSEYLHGLEGFEKKWAVKNYFSGGGEVVLEAIALRRASEKKWVVSAEESDFTAIRRDEGPVNDEI